MTYRYIDFLFIDNAMAKQEKKDQLTTNSTQNTTSRTKD